MDPRDTDDGTLGRESLVGHGGPAGAGEPGRSDGDEGRPGRSVTPTSPLILTVMLDEVSQAQFDVLRRTHFPPERNFLAAHVTMFHALPGELLDDIAAHLRALAPDSPVAVTVTGVRFLGRGVAYNLDAPHLESIRMSLAERWQPWLSAQDRQPWRPHVTVQNKATPEVARALYARLAADFVAHDVHAVGWELCRYLGGPWQSLAKVPFTGASS